MDRCLPDKLKSPDEEGAEMRDKRGKGSTSQVVEQRDQRVSQDLKNLSCSLKNALGQVFLSLCFKTGVFQK